MTSLENRALAYILVLMDSLLPCGSLGETAYTVQCIVLYCFSKLTVYAVKYQMAKPLDIGELTGSPQNHTQIGACHFMQ